MLKNPVARVAYLLELEGVLKRSEQDAAKQVPAALLEEVFALNEELDVVRELRKGGAPPDVWKVRLERASAPIEAKQAAHEAELKDLSARWDALGENRGPGHAAILTVLRDCVLERNYINNLLEGIERELNA